MKSVATYLRVCPDDHQYTARQADEILRLVACRGWSVTERCCDDDENDSVRKLMKILRRRRHELDVLVVHHAASLFRSAAEMIATLDELAHLEIGFVSATEPFDSTSTEPVSSGELLARFVAAFAAFERDAVRRPPPRGRPLAAFSVARARELRTDGMSIRAIARELNVGSATVCRALGVPKTPS